MLLRSLRNLLCVLRRVRSLPLDQKQHCLPHLNSDVKIVKLIAHEIKANSEPARESEYQIWFYHILICTKDDQKKSTPRGAELSKTLTL